MNFHLLSVNGPLSRLLVVAWRLANEEELKGLGERDAALMQLAFSFRPFRVSWFYQRSMSISMKWRRLLQKCRSDFNGEQDRTSHQFRWRLDAFSSILGGVYVHSTRSRSATLPGGSTYGEERFHYSRRRTCQTESGVRLAVFILSLTGFGDTKPRPLFLIRDSRSRSSAKLRLFQIAHVSS